MYQLKWFYKADRSINGEGNPSSDPATLGAWVREMNNKHPDIYHYVAKVPEQKPSTTEDQAMNDDLLIPVQVGFEQVDLEQESVHTLVAALEDWCDGEIARRP